MLQQSLFKSINVLTKNFKIKNAIFHKVIYINNNNNNNYIFLSYPKEKSPFQGSIKFKNNFFTSNDKITDQVNLKNRKLQNTISFKNTVSFKIGNLKYSSFQIRDYSVSPNVVKRVEDSIIEVYLPFSTDTILRNHYINSYGDLRIGLIMEDFDNLAGTVAYKHADDRYLPVRDEVDRSKPNAYVRKAQESDFVIVTACVDRIDFKSRLHANVDIKIKGFVTWVGKSSMEIRIEARTVKEDKEELVVVALFTMVARDKNNIAIQVPKIQPETEYEKLLFNFAEENAIRRRLSKNTELDAHPPTAEESMLIHSLFMKTHDKINSEKYIYMEDTRLQTTLFMHPQQKNIHNKIFGGFLVRMAFELSFSTCTTFNKGRPFFKSLDDTRFLHPVEIGSIVIFSSQVVYTDTDSVQVQVVAEVLHPQTGERKVTNTFQFAYAIPVKVHVVPKTYEDAMHYLSGKRSNELGELMSKKITF